ncbi:hypothetical protein T265_04590 [Opisthorchis viverrini]|uniref:Uncharacterized protein n=1 Tax=Opisthorchis viverrini TaxID=6198 RepID=A0A074ZZC0_OPIVI|nr:hypothetical protein T265_04590 [Opisthorchis viverrini]KER28640.1 hypothetical protein T265_04590 [Opisthorchis viverrini]
MDRGEELKAKNVRHAFFRLFAAFPGRHQVPNQCSAVNEEIMDTKWDKSGQQDEERLATGQRIEGV